ncbi:MAG: LacI family DNA-binding transcriptional regulator [Anaerolineales bacterium]|nr:LacI family DNA-binding transcriptional regulator [Anaerolineales bacterium]
MAQVAKRAGVSKATISHVINNTRYVSEETRQAVLNAIKELNYTPSQIARSLTVQRTFTAGLLISDVGNPFYHHVILGVEDTALAHGYSVYLFNASYDVQRSIKYLQSMIERRVDGIMLMSSRMTDEIVTEATNYGVPTVILDWNEFDMHQAGSIVFNFEEGIRKAVDHLCDLGHTRFAHVSGNLELWTAKIRRDLFLQALAERGLDPDHATVIEGDFTIEGGKRALHKLMQGPSSPTAVITVNDMTALGMLFEAANLGMVVPHDFSVIGMDDITLASQVIPSLTTIALPRYEIGKLAMMILLDLIEAPDEGEFDSMQFHRVVNTELIIRESTAPPKDLSV